MFVRWRKLIITALLRSLLPHVGSVEIRTRLVGPKFSKKKIPRQVLSYGIKTGGYDLWGFVRGSFDLLPGSYRSLNYAIGSTLHCSGARPGARALVCLESHMSHCVKKG